MAIIFEKCGEREILMSGSLYGVPDAEPYEEGIEEDTGILDVDIDVTFSYCPKCKGFNSVTTINN